jgi:hypothetical protein
LRRTVRSRAQFWHPSDRGQLRLRDGSYWNFGEMNRDPRAGGSRPVEVDRKFVIIMRLDLGTFVRMIVFRKAKMRMSKACCVMVIRIVRMHVREGSLHIGARENSRQERCVCLPQHQNKSSAFCPKPVGGRPSARGSQPRWSTEVKCRRRPESRPRACPPWPSASQYCLDER